MHPDFSIISVDNATSAEYDMSGEVNLMPIPNEINVISEAPPSYGLIYTQLRGTTPENERRCRKLLHSVVAGGLKIDMKTNEVGDYLTELYSKTMYNVVCILDCDNKRSLKLNEVMRRSSNNTQDAIEIFIPGTEDSKEWILDSVRNTQREGIFCTRDFWTALQKSKVIQERGEGKRTQNVYWGRLVVGNAARVRGDSLEFGKTPQGGTVWTLYDQRNNSFYVKHGAQIWIQACLVLRLDLTPDNARMYLATPQNPTMREIAHEMIRDARLSSGQKSKWIRIGTKVLFNLTLDGVKAEGSVQGVLRVQPGGYMVEPFTKEARDFVRMENTVDKVKMEFYKKHEYELHWKLVGDPEVVEEGPSG